MLCMSFKAFAKLSIIFAILSMVSVVSANHYSFPDETIEYSGSSIDVTIGCDSSNGLCPDRYADYYQLNICGERAARKRGNFGVTSPTSSYTFTNIEIPEDARCGQGDHEFRFIPEPENRDSSPQHIGSGGNLNVEASNMANAHRGDNLIVNYDTGNDQLRNFQLTNDFWDIGATSHSDSVSPRNGVIMIQDYDDRIIGNDHSRSEVALEPDQDPILDYTMNLDEYTDDSGPHTNEVDARYDATGVLSSTDFNSGNSFKYGDVGSNWGINSQSPVHAEGNYGPDGEIILGYEPIVGTGYNDYDSFSPSSDESQVISSLSTGIDVDPTQTNNDIRMEWNSPITMNSEKTVTYTMNFDERGHSRIEYRNSGGLVANFNTDATGTNDIWFYCYTCDDSIFETISSSDHYGQLPVDYQTGREYDFEVRRANGGLEFTIREDGAEIWTHTESSINDFGFTRVETWESWAGGSTVKPQYQITGMEVSGGSSGPHFYVCREGAEMQDGAGGTTRQVVDGATGSDESLYKCSFDRNGGWDWIEVTQCRDGLDNDANGKIDGNDRSCQEGNNVEDGSVPPLPGSCDPGQVIVEGSGSLSETMKACYTTGGGNIQKQPYEDWDWTEDIGGPTVTAWAPKDPQIKDCNRGTTPRPEGCLSSSEYANHWSSDSTMPTVEYGAWSDYFVDLAQLQGKEEEFRNGNYALETDFVADNIGWVTQWQPLYTAERRYDADQTGLAPNPDNCDRCNDPDWWNQVNMSFVGDQSTSTRYYNSSTGLEHEDAWIVGNAGSEAVDGIASVNYADGDSENQVFSGGWIVECDNSLVEEGENNWRFAAGIGSWACTGIQSPPGGGGGIGGTSIDNPVEVPGFSTTTYLPDTETTSNGEREIGIIQFPYLNRDASNRPDYLPNEVSTYVEAAASNGITDQINEIEAKCWTGGLDQEPSTCNSDNGCFTDTASYSSTGPWGVAQEVSTDGRSGYACKWAYKTDKFNDGNSNADGVVGDESSVTVHLHRHQNQGDNYNDFWQSITGQYQGIKKEYPAGELTGLLP